MAFIEQTPPEEIFDIGNDVLAELGEMFPDNRTSFSRRAVILQNAEGNFDLFRESFDMNFVPFEKSRELEPLEPVRRKIQELGRVVVPMGYRELWVRWDSVRWIQQGARDTENPHNTALTHIDMDELLAAGDVGTEYVLPMKELVSPKDRPAGGTYQVDVLEGLEKAGRTDDYTLWRPKPGVLVDKKFTHAHRTPEIRDSEMAGRPNRALLIIQKPSKYSRLRTI